MTALSHPEPRGSMAASRAWRGAAILSRGFRPFFLAAGIWAVVGMALWPAIFTGAIVAPTEFSAVDWHAHEMIFGYGAAVVAGFLLTAIPNWTGRLPVAGVPLAALVGLWAAGRIAVFASAAIGRPAAAVIELVVPHRLRGAGRPRGGGGRLRERLSLVDRRPSSGRLALSGQSADRSGHTFGG